MKPLIPIACFFVCISCAHGNEKSDMDAHPKLQSDVDMKSAEAMLKSGISRPDLAEKLNTIPLIRVGPGYTIYWLEDGSLKIPYQEDDAKIIKEWQIQAYEVKEAEQSVVE